MGTNALPSGPYETLGPIFGFDPDEARQEHERIANARDSFEVLGPIFGFDADEARREFAAKQQASTRDRVRHTVNVDNDDPLGLGLPAMPSTRDDDNPLGIFGEDGEPDDGLLV